MRNRTGAEKIRPIDPFAQTLEESLAIAIDWRERLELRRDQVAAAIATKSAEIERLALADGDELAAHRSRRLRVAIDELSREANNIASGLTLTTDRAQRLANQQRAAAVDEAEGGRT